MIALIALIWVGYAIAGTVISLGATRWLWHDLPESERLLNAVCVAVLWPTFIALLVALSLVVMVGTALGAFIHWTGDRVKRFVRL